MRYAAIASLLLLSGAPAHAAVSIGISIPGVQIGINVPVYPELVAVPGYPVYYDPRANSNFFFYDGLYWVYQQDDWYASDWYDGPWRMVGPEYVPLFVLRVPVQYYRRAPPYFRGWNGNAAPHWGEHWGRNWEERRSGWDRWDRRAAPAAAPLPAYQRQYSGDRYPRADDQRQSIRQQNYSYAPREAVTRQQLQQQERASGTRTAPQQREPAPARSQASQQQREPAPARSQAPQQQTAARSDRPGRETQTSRPTNQTEAAQRPQAEPRQGDRRNAPPPHDSGSDARAASQDKSRQVAAAQPARSRPATPQPQDGGRDAKGPQQDKSRENKKEEHGQNGG